ncbi:two-component system sensor histidine kinase YesM [Parabacteroides sp. PF5-5]|uniref:tetratricopeptide repeat-containing sensor histidine kinase n=1 Tax=unclassified Parabacteroides TaxID=2649774 RepID=UPI002476BCCD|nr:MULTISPECIES: histidine kinase [unclassified Parabacteroides]MDH6306349.1 two-component system sensor histidine kinase YesM [Parabacteroides sp. PH5-39]MDH6314621.1 two-component system sensor histidine kinase YesM [Parabacteroides sp. PF5-13]MDH6321060.1 two-component system sensor histidine kinase YesM [Parabacteroides sp. PH5-13]MDH6324792.1 two-component system sensor histidine kinase YesM [Parabacteroides sp. PH5-8]MDH6325527.1 two-component system sensor histidine kinase YesM [Parabac
MKYCIYIMLFLFPFIAWGQESVQKKQSSKSSKSAVFELSRSLEQDLPSDTIAADYEKVAQEYVEKGEYIKAEDYLVKARKLYVRDNNRLKMAYIEREIARAQEWQGNYTAAIQSYTNAAGLSQDTYQKNLNENDALRLKNLMNPEKQSVYIQRNLDLLNTMPQNANKEEKVLAYSQLAQVNKEMKDNAAAVSNLQSALEVAETPIQSRQVRRQMADVYASENQMDKAISINEKILEEAAEEQDTKAQIEQLQTLSTAYIETRDVSKGIASLQQAYELAIEKGHTLDAKNSLELLVAQYRKENQNRKALEAYSDFMAKLEPLIREDSTLIDEKVFQAHEEKIAQLEKERDLKDRLIGQQKTLNKLQTLATILFFVAFIVALFMVLSILRKNKKIALQSLRREMNPHFIFNSLNSVNQFIAQNNELEANKYLSSYSRLMRNMMENSSKDFTSLSTELEQLKEYLELEQMRFHDKFTYTIEIDDSLDADALRIPNMLIQPQLENAIWHGLRYRESNGLLHLSIQKENKHLAVKIEDNGIGLKKSKELKTKHQKEHQSRGLKNTYERIKLLNSLYHSKITIDITDKDGEETGVIVLFRFPL